MHYIHLAQSEGKHLGFYLAMEEYVARHVYDGTDCFFIWQVNPTVVCGRHQVVENEVNLDYCQTHGIQVVRRKSGGGCVFTDRGNLMLSYITGEENLTQAFDHYLALLTRALNGMGIPAERNDHNDVMLNGQKISGNAMWHVPGRTIAHGTLLYDVDMEHITHAITPNQQKLSKNGVQSVRQRITLLKNYTSLSINEVWQHLRQDICTDTIELPQSAMSVIEQMAQEYLTLRDPEEE